MKRYKKRFKEYSRNDEQLQYFIDNVKKSSKEMMLSELGISLDLTNWKKAKIQFEKELQKASDLSERELINRYPGIDIDYMHIEHPDLEEIFADNTYNWSYLGVDVNMRGYQDSSGNHILLLNVHTSMGDIRGGYGDNIYFDTGKHSPSQIAIEMLHGLITVIVTFTDRSYLIADSQQDSDVEYYEIYQVKGKGIAQEFEDYFNSLSDRSDRDEAINSLVE